MKNDTKILLLVLGLSAAAIIFILLSSTKTQVAEAEMVNAGGNVLGESTSQNILVEFSDFFCPACQAAEPYVAQIISKYPGRIKFIYRHFPLPQHPLAFKAAQAAEAAGRQGKFWEYKENLFASQESLVDPTFVEIAQKLNLDLNKFTEDMNSAEVLSAVQKDMAASRELNLNSTPTFFLNGEKLNFTSFEDLVKTVESKLK